MIEHTKVLVTGGAGFIGRRLVPMLSRNGFDVVVYDNLSRGHKDAVEDACYGFIQGDVRNQLELEEAMEGCSTVVHLAAFGSVIESINDPVDNFSQNVLGSFTVMNAARNVGIHKVLFASTGGALIGDAEPPVSENSLPRPISPYGASKLCGEAYIHAFASAYDMETVALRFGNVYGPGSAHKKGAVTVWAKALLSDEPIIIYGDGCASRDFLYVDDLCEGIMKSLNITLPGGTVLHLASNSETTVKKLAELMCVAAKKNNHPIEYKPARKGEVTRNFADYAKAKTMIGFEPKVPLNIGIEKTWQWFASLSSDELNVEMTDS